MKVSCEGEAVKKVKKLTSFYTVDDFVFLVIVERIGCQIMTELKTFVHIQIDCEPWQC
jgi:hypothetical protein